MMLQLFHREISSHFKGWNRIGPERSNLEVAIKEKLFLHLEHSHHKMVFTDQHGVNVPPYACKFCTVPGQEHVCLVVDEEGYVSVIDTVLLDSMKHDNYSSSLSIKEKWITHNNAVFDVTWIPQSAQFVTASGDTTAILWDVTRPTEKLCVFRGHSCSLKSVTVSKENPNLLATGSRDGNILVWDSRCSSANSPECQAVLRIQAAHAVYDALTPQRKRRRRVVAHNNNQLLTDSQQTVTSVIFQDSSTLISSGAMDGTLKLWDVRKVSCDSSRRFSKMQQKPASPKECIAYPGLSERRRGYNTLTLDSTSTRLFASCTDNTVYEYDLCGLPASSRIPRNRYTGHYSSSFYIRIALSPDDLFLLSGCDDEMAFVWKTAQVEPEPVPPVFRLKSAGMEQVTSVAWSPVDDTRFVTCSDDCAMRLWKVPERFPKSTKSDGYCEAVEPVRPEGVSLSSHGPSGRNSPVGFFKRTSFSNPGTPQQCSPPSTPGVLREVSVSRQWSLDAPNRNSSPTSFAAKPAAASIKDWLLPAMSPARPLQQQSDEDKENCEFEETVASSPCRPLAVAVTGNDGSKKVGPVVKAKKSSGNKTRALGRRRGSSRGRSKTAAARLDFNKRHYSIKTYFANKAG